MRKVSLAVAFISLLAANAVAGAGVAAAGLVSDREIKRDVTPVRWDR
ncbi:hypothetical protein [Nocardia carnea]|nr:hypothetical protein [Nocardia carnea]